MKNKPTIKVLIVDDESLARKRIIHFLNDYPEIEIIGECKNGIEAYLFINNNKTDLVFLDIQMPEMTGLELIEVFGYKKFPAVIFVTAYNQHAIKAFEYCAVDYLLKPFSKKRLAQAVSQALKRLDKNNSEDQIETIQKLIESSKPKLVERIFIKESGLIKVIETSTIDYIESSGNYVTIHSNNKSYLHRQTMKNLEQFLDQTKFIRVHRSFIVHIQKILSLSPLTGGDYTLHLKNKSTITLSRRYKDNLSKLFKL